MSFVLTSTPGQASVGLQWGWRTRAASPVTTRAKNRSHGDSLSSPPSLLLDARQSAPLGFCRTTAIGVAPGGGAAQALRAGSTSPRLCARRSSLRQTGQLYESSRTGFVETA